VARRLGWRTEFPWQRYTNWVARSERVYLIERRAVPPLGHFSLIRFGKHPVGALEAQARLAAAV
jgi:phosphatidylethanolamine/phosphatidyl-N-methylethanolamine N-methyltransferase